MATKDEQTTRITDEIHLYNDNNQITITVPRTDYKIYTKKDNKKYLKSVMKKNTIKNAIKILDKRMKSTFEEIETIMKKHNVYGRCKVHEDRVVVDMKLREEDLFYSFFYNGDTCKWLVSKHVDQVSYISNDVPNLVQKLFSLNNFYNLCNDFSKQLTDFIARY
jgi:hypothetical protein